MDMKHYIIKIACNADARQKYLEQAPHLFNDYFITRSGEVVTGEEFESLNAFNYFLNGLDFFSQVVMAN